MAAESEQEAAEPILPRGRVSLQPWVHSSAQDVVLWAMAAPASLVTSVEPHPV